MNRRTFLKASTAVAISAAAARNFSFAADTEIELSLGEAGATISPHIYGHFIEHLGGVIYDGVWVGRNSKVPNVDGIRKEFIDDMKRIGAPNLRWPGGCFADGYHWRDGIGKSRPRTYNYWQSRMPAGLDATETNQFGIHEFMNLCRQIGAEPYIAANVGSSTPKEFHDWVSYCNAPAGTLSLADERAANGDKQPFNVRYWGVGNESWGCGGTMRPEEYATLYRKWITQFPSYVQPFLVAAGPRGHAPDTDIGWTTGFFENMRGYQPPDGFALHFYTDLRPTTIKAADFNASEWYEVLLRGVRLEKIIQDHWTEMGKFDPTHKTKFVVDEWGVWYKPGEEIQPELHPKFSHDPARRRPHRPDLRHLQPSRRKNRYGQRGPDRELHPLAVPRARRQIRPHPRLLCLRNVSRAHGSSAAGSKKSRARLECVRHKRRSNAARTLRLRQPPQQTSDSHTDQPIAG